MSIRVLVADDQDLVRTGLRLILGTLDGIEVVGEARDGKEAVRLARELRPDVCLMDIRMPVLDGVEATRLLAGPGVEDPVAVVVITTFDLDEYVHGALSAGATGFLLKDAGPELLGEAIRAATRGDSLISPSITRRLLSTFARTGRAEPPVQPLDPLTEREEQVLLTIARGRTNAEIAAELYISLSTVKTHIGSLMAKLGARNRVEIAMWAYETGRVRASRPAHSAGRTTGLGERPPSPAGNPTGRDPRPVVRSRLTADRGVQPVLRPLWSAQGGGTYLRSTESTVPAPCFRSGQDRPLNRCAHDVMPRWLNP